MVERALEAVRLGARLVRVVIGVGLLKAAFWVLGPHMVETQIGDWHISKRIIWGEPTDPLTTSEQ